MASTRRLAAILAADVAGYSRLMGADGEGTHERLSLVAVAFQHQVGHAPDVDLRDHTRRLSRERLCTVNTPSIGNPKTMQSWPLLGYKFWP